MEDNVLQQELPLPTPVTFAHRKRGPNWEHLPAYVRRSVRELLVAHTVRGMIKWKNLLREAATMDAVNGYTPGQLRMMIYKCRDQRHPGIVKPFLCPECRAAGLSRRFPNLQGMGMHRSRAHGAAGRRGATDVQVEPTPPRARLLPERDVSQLVQEITVQEAARSFVSAKNRLAVSTSVANFCPNCGTNLKALYAVAEVHFCPSCGERVSP